MNTNYEMIRYLGHCYFHEDWQDDSPTPTAVVELFAARNPIYYSHRLLDELKSASEPALNESIAERIWVEIADGMYDPTVDGLTYQGWVNSVVETIQQFLETHQPASRA